MNYLFIIFSIFSSVTYAQQSVLEYDILHKGALIGAMKLNLNKDGTSTSIKMDSRVEVKFIISTIIKMNEKSVFEKDKLIYSEATRSVNETTKQNNQTKAVDGFYHTISKGKTTVQKISSINYNLLLLYFKEPENVSQVYSDSFQQFLKIEKLAPHHYKIKLPNRDYNEYYFQNGICKRVVIHSTFFQVEMKLKPNVIVNKLE